MITALKAIFEDKSALNMAALKTAASSYGIALGVVGVITFFLNGNQQLLIYGSGLAIFSTVAFIRFLLKSDFKSKSVDPSADLKWGIAATLMGIPTLMIVSNSLGWLLGVAPP